MFNRGFTAILQKKKTTEIKPIWFILIEVFFLVDFQNLRFSQTLWPLNTKLLKISNFENRRAKTNSHNQKSIISAILVFVSKNFIGSSSEHKNLKELHKSSDYLGFWIVWENTNGISISPKISFVLMLKHRSEICLPWNLC
jgi:hypothetical protein